MFERVRPNATVIVGNYKGTRVEVLSVTGEFRGEWPVRFVDPADRRMIVHLWLSPSELLFDTDDENEGTS